MTSTTPDSTGVTTQSVNTYDNIGRPRTRKAGGATTTYTYDPAGSPITVLSGRALSVTTTYAALNRLLTKVVPLVDYAQVACTPGTVDCRWVFPYYPNNGTGLRILADTARFSYDVVGNLLTANNKDSQVLRTYTKSGWLVTDSLKLRTYAGTSFATHKWGLRATYDSLGRRRSLKHPALLYNVEGGSTTDSVTYIYNAGTGALSEVRDVRGRQFTYTDDAAGRQKQLDIRPTVGGAIGVSEVDTLDADGRMRRRLIYLAGSGTPTSAAAISNDARGKQRSVN
jgi:YD repeat-containing protein